MQIHLDSDEYEATHDTTTCRFHRLNPGVAYAGCTCSASFGQRRRSNDEIAEIKKRKQKEREDSILAAADEIRKARSMRPS